MRAALVLAMLTAVCVPASAAAAGELHAPDTSQAAAPDCRSVQIPVALAPEESQNAQLDGQVCYPANSASSMPGTIQVLVSGATYGRSYWDFPYQRDTYSYVRAAAAAGFTTFNFDRIGIGQSTHPASTDVTIPANAYTIHQAIQQLRSGRWTAPRTARW